MVTTSPTASPFSLVTTFKGTYLIKLSGGAGAEAEIRTFGSMEPEQKRNMFDSATLIFEQERAKHRFDLLECFLCRHLCEALFINKKLRIDVVSARAHSYLLTYRHLRVRPPKCFQTGSPEPKETALDYPF